MSESNMLNFMADNQEISVPKRSFDYGANFSVTSWTGTETKNVRFSNGNNEVSINLSQEQAEALASVLLDKPNKPNKTLTMTSCCFDKDAFFKFFSTPEAQKTLRKIIFGDSNPVERKNENPDNSTRV